MIKNLRGFISKSRTVGANFLHLGMIQVSNALLQLLLFPIIIRKTGIEAFGPVVVANSFGALMGLWANFGTSISGVQAVAAIRSDKVKLSELFSQTLVLRFFLGVISLLVLPVAQLVRPDYYPYLLLILPLVAAEIINPLYLFNGLEHLLPFNLGNLLCKLASAFFIVTLVSSAADAPWVNFYLGLPALIGYAILNVYLFRRLQLKWMPVSKMHLLRLARKNLPLAGNNLAVQLQQSFFLFVLSGLGNSILLGAYALVDKIIWGFRLLLIAFSNALFPRAVVLAGTDPVLARQRKKQINGVLAVVFGVVAILLYLLPHLVVRLFAGDDHPIVVSLVQAIALVPLLAALNLLNVVELLVQQRYKDIFRIALLLTLLTVSLSIFMIRLMPLRFIGTYPLIMEAAALALYLYFIQLNFKKPSVG